MRSAEKIAKEIDRVKSDILGKEYSLSIAYVSENKSRGINKKYRKKDKATNILSFSLRKDAGEIILCKAVITKEAKKMKKKNAEWLRFLVIHGMLHLKGLQHSARMERAEDFYCKKYDKEYFGGNRRGLGYDKGRSGRVYQGR